MQQAIIVVSFGTKYPDQKKKYIDPCYDAIRAAYPDWQVYECFSSNLLRKRLEEECGIHVFTPEEILKALKRCGCERVMIQPLLIMEGREYEKLMRLKLSYTPYMHISLGKPLLSKQEDYDQIAQELKEQYGGKNKEILLIGHGNSQTDEKVYKKLQEAVSKVLPNIHMINLEERNKAGQLPLESKEILVIPFMLIAGTHVLRTVLGEKEAHWRRELEDRGCTIELEQGGIGHLKCVEKIFVQHIADQL